MAAEYSYSELMQMQDRAIERVREMQERARRTMEENPINLTKDEAEEQEKEEPPEEASVRENKPPKARVNTAKRINLDRDKATVLPLLLLLMNEGADSLLLLALIYIMA